MAGSETGLVPPHLAISYTVFPGDHVRYLHTTTFVMIETYMLYILFQHNLLGIEPQKEVVNECFDGFV